MKFLSVHGNLSPDKARLNLALSRSRIVVENAFIRLKSHLQCIAKRLDMIITCCILHNFCIITKQKFLHEWLQQTEVDPVAKSKCFTMC